MQAQVGRGARVQEEQSKDHREAEVASGRRPSWVGKPRDRALGRGGRGGLSWVKDHKVG